METNPKEIHSKNRNITDSVSSVSSISEIEAWNQWNQFPQLVKMNNIIQEFCTVYDSSIRLPGSMEGIAKLLQPLYARKKAVLLLFSVRIRHCIVPILCNAMEESRKGF